MNDLIFGYTWEQIQKAQQGGVLTQILPLTAKAATSDICTKSDLDLFIKHGKGGLEDKQFYGVIDRLKQAGIITT